MADRNKSGKIELVELEDMFGTFGMPTDSDVLNKAFLHLDKNFDGEISFEEFWAWWQSMPAFRPRGGVGEQGRPTNKQQNARLSAANNVGRSGPLDVGQPLDIDSFNLMRSKSRARRMNPNLMPQASAQPKGGFVRTQPIRAASCGGDVLAEQ